MKSAVNEIKVGKQDFRFYLGQCNIKLRTNDEVVLSSVEVFKEKIVYIADNLVNCGFAQIDKRECWDREKNKIKWIKETIKVLDKDTGRIKNVTFYKLKLLKNPELFKYTKKDNESLIGEIIEEEGEDD